MDPTKETKEAFMRRYKDAAGKDGRYVRWGENGIALPCTCPDGGGPTHWAFVSNTPEAIDAHWEMEDVFRFNYGNVHVVPVRKEAK